MKEQLRLIVVLIRYLSRQVYRLILIVMRHVVDRLNLYP
jgi:hypothetical protein